jgi:hypothetical protein
VGQMPHQSMVLKNALPNAGHILEIAGDSISFAYHFFIATKDHFAVI